MGKKHRFHTPFEESLYLNNSSYMYYLNKLMEIGISSITYENLPDTVDERTIELGLFLKGVMVYFRDEVIGDLCLNVIYNGRLDVYGEPILRRAYSGYTDYNRLLKKSNSVIIWNNFMRKSSVEILEMYARKLWVLDRIVMVNANAQKTPVLIEADEKEKLTMTNLYKEWDGMAPVIYGYRGLAKDGLNVLKTDAPYVADKIYELKEKYWAEALTYLGIVNVAYEKAERVQAMEVERQLGGVFAYRQARMRAREVAVEKINKMFGTKIKVQFNEPNASTLLPFRKQEEVREKEVIDHE